MEKKENYKSNMIIYKKKTHQMDLPGRSHGVDIWFYIPWEIAFHHCDTITSVTVVGCTHVTN